MGISGAKSPLAGECLERAQRLNRPACVDHEGGGLVVLSPDGGVDQPYFLTRRQTRGDLGDDVEIGGAEHLGKCRPNRISSIACRGIHESPSYTSVLISRRPFGRHLIHAYPGIWARDLASKIRQSDPLCCCVHPQPGQLWDRVQAASRPCGNAGGFAGLSR